MKKVVSVIIPVYNVEEFIFRTVESVMNQDYKNIEIILVDDGSLDNSAKIINELAKKDDRITCVHKENGGVLSARNAGLRIASGEYVTFIDGDDWVEPKYISCLLNLVESNKCEIGMNKIIIQIIIQNPMKKSMLYQPKKLLNGFTWAIFLLQFGIRFIA